MKNTTATQVNLSLDNFYDHDWVYKQDAAADELVQWAMANQKLKNLANWSSISPGGTGYGCSCDEQEMIPNQDTYVYKIPVVGDVKEVKQNLAKNPDFKGILDINRVVEHIDDDMPYHDIEIVYCDKCKEWTIYYGA